MDHPGGFSKEALDEPPLSEMRPMSTHAMVWESGFLQKAGYGTKSMSARTGQGNGYFFSLSGAGR